MYTAPPPPPPTAFYPPSTSAGSSLLSSYFASGLANPPPSLIPHPANPLSLSPYMSAAFPQASNSSIHSFLAAIEAASAVAQMQQQQHLINNNNNSPEIKRPIPQIAVSPANNQTLVNAFKKTNSQIPFPLI